MTQDPWELAGIWVAALLTLFALSFLYKENPFYRFAESLFVGVSAGYGAATIFHQTFRQDLAIPLLSSVKASWGDSTALWAVFHRLVAISFGVLILARFTQRYAWLSRWPLALVIGMGTGIGIPALVQGFILPQIYATVDPLIRMDDPAARIQAASDMSSQLQRTVLPPLMWGNVLIIDTISKILVLVGVLAVLAYFFFSKEHKGAYGRFTRLGVYFVMVGFGALFGNTVMARMALLIGRIQFLMWDWLGTFGVHIRT
jgi:hypothetical protein